MPTTPKNIAQKYLDESMSVAQIASKYHIGVMKVKEHLQAQGVTLRTQVESRELYNRTRRPAVQRRTCSQCHAEKNIDQFPRSGKLVSMCMSCLDGLAGCVRRCPHCGHMRLWWSFFVDGFETYTTECRMCRTQLQRGSTLQSIRRVKIVK